jgi:hypothetical protein
LTEVQAGDDARALLARADSALYSAKAAGNNRLFVHDGSHIREDIDAAPPVAEETTGRENMAPILDGTAAAECPIESGY